MKLLLIFLVVLVSIGCASQPLYIPPTSGSIANVKHVNNSLDFSTTLYFYEDAISCKGPQSFTANKARLNKGYLAFGANRPFTFMLDHHNGLNYCRHSFMFTPEPGNYRLVTSVTNEKCFLTVEQAVNNEATKWKTVTSIVERKHKTPFLKSGEFCHPL